MRRYIFLSAMLPTKVIFSFGLLLTCTHQSNSTDQNQSKDSTDIPQSSLVRMPSGPIELRSDSIDVSVSEPGPGLLSEYAETLQNIIKDFSKFYQSGCIFPGTKYCGKGTNATKDKDFGSRKYTDKCCYQHDSCDDIISTGTEKHGLENDTEFTLLHCKCDIAFLECLRKNIKNGNNVKTSTAVGTIYFNRPQKPQCYRLDYPIRSCLEMSTILNDRCIKYDLDETQEKQWQFFDLPSFDLMYTYYSYTERLSEWSTCIVL